jgi:hypothetical protein
MGPHVDASNLFGVSGRCVGTIVAWRCPLLGSSRRRAQDTASSREEGAIAALAAVGPDELADLLVLGVDVFRQPTPQEHGDREGKQRAA